MLRVALLAAVTVFGFVGPVHAGASDYFGEKVKDFGTTPRGPILIHHFWVKNTSGANVTIGQPRVSCGCTSAAVQKNQLAPGEATVVTAHMDTKRITTSGVTKRVTIFVPFFAPIQEEVALAVQCVVRDDLIIGPDTLAFGSVPFGRGGQAAVRITHMSDPNWQISDVRSTGAYIKPTVTLVGRQGSQITYEVTADLDPTCPPGNWVAEIYLTTTGVGMEKLRIPATVQVIAPSIAANPEAVRFGELKVGDTGEQQLVVKGGEPFKVVEVKGGEDMIKVTPLHQDARSVHVLRLELTPKEAGDLARTLEVLTDSKAQPRISVPLTAKVRNQ